jgi:hypothetical protein
MKGISILGFWGSVVKKRLLKGKFLFSLFVSLVVCPFLGQAHNGITPRLKGERLFFEMDSMALEVPMLLVRHGTGQRHVKWRRENGHILLVSHRVQSWTGVMVPILSDYSIDEQLLGRFAIEKSNDGIFEIEVTELFLYSPIQWNAYHIPDSGIPGKSYIKEVGQLEGESLVSTLWTVHRKGKQFTKTVDFSVYRLPEPMEPRKYDHRMGFFYEDKYSSLNTEPKTDVGSITRWRLEKGSADNGVPVKPIVFYLDPKIPDKWKPYVKAGVLEWLRAFEAAGFTNAIEVREVKDEADWHEHSVHYSIIRWTSFSGIRGSEGKHGGTARSIIDLRTGEILKSDIYLGSSYQSLMDDYFVRCAPLDKRALRYPFPDDLLGSLIQGLTAHEAGHAFGIRDAHYGEYAYPFGMMRNENWLRRMSHSPSIMNYARDNYIPQPSDSIDPALLMPTLGPADRYQIKWGYMTVNGREEERSGIDPLEALVGQQDSVPWLRSHRNYQLIGPQCTSEVVDNSDPIASTTMGLKNLERTLALLPTLNGGGIANSHVQRLYHKSLDLWYRQMLHVTSLIGGQTINHAMGPQKGPVYVPIDPKVQMEAVTFMMDNAFVVPEWLSAPGFLDRIQPSHDPDVLLNFQLILLKELLDKDRLVRLGRLHTFKQGGAGDLKLLSELRTGLFRELEHGDMNIVDRRKELQLAYISMLGEIMVQDWEYRSMHGPGDQQYYSTRVRGHCSLLLHGLRKDLEYALKCTREPSNRGYLLLCLQKIEDLL